MKPKIIFSLVLLVIASACGNTYKLLSVDQDESVDFSRYKTFALLPDKDNENTPYHNQIIHNNTENYLTHELMNRGMTVDKDKPDILLQLQINSKSKQRTQTTSIPPPSYYYYPALSPHNPYFIPHGFLYYYYNMPFGYIPNYTYGITRQTIDYTQSTITLNVIDRKANRLIWQATVQADLYDPSQMKKELHPAVRKILDKYPVKPLSDNR